MTRVAPSAAVALARAAECDAATKDLVACLADLEARLARAPSPDSPMQTVLGLGGEINSPGAR
jgi:hypothetical protein